MTKSIPLREKLVAFFGALTLAYSAWGLGGVLAWSLHLMLGGGLLTLALAIFPFPQTKTGRPERSWDFPKALACLLRFPGAWFASAFLVYLAISAFNPTWHIVSDERGWWLESIEPPLASWLPTSVAAPYEPMNVWRIFNMHLAAFSLAFGLVFGLKRRRSVLFVLWAFILSCSVMAVIAILQKYSGADTVLGLFKSENPHFWGSFFYRNQAVAYLNWGIVISGALYFYHARRSREEGRSGGPHFITFCFIGLIAVSVSLALSRGGILFGGILVAVFVLFAALDYLVSAFRNSRISIFLPLTFILTLLLSVGLYQVFRVIDWHAINERFGGFEVSIQNADKDTRVLSSKLTWEMAQDNIWMGWGAGSFRYAFPMYQQKVPEIFYSHLTRKRGWIGRRFFRYAHNDILQFLAEYGTVGCSLLLLTISSLFLPVLQSIFRSPLSTIYSICGVVCAFAHAFVDFIFHSPAFWLAFVGGIALLGRLVVLERRRE